MEMVSPFEFQVLQLKKKHTYLLLVYFSTSLLSFSQIEVKLTPLLIVIRAFKRRNLEKNEQNLLGSFNAI